MNYRLLQEVISLVETFENHHEEQNHSPDIAGFKRWLYESHIQTELSTMEPEWEGKTKGRSPESVINTLLVHLNRYARTYSKSAIVGSDFSTQEEFIYLINLRAFGAMTKMQLIKKNIQEKPVGMQIINRLLKQGWIIQTDSESDKRSKVINISTKGEAALEGQMHKIRRATQVVTGNLTHTEKMELIRLLTKLDRFHQPIFQQQLSPEELLEQAWSRYPFEKIK
ncbi:MarR family transcriptional regulator [Olivibacter sp. SDN3]|uniref:MarR family winged helix-turn-helix transcriptional regulator n=1 Tax=Olivibacter sp. SDN3 TaxID=2764720 RepID=UPI001651A57A|nr:helix-turn-helix domain-containing protein [Olivibacter sp. SDN3]QNL51696.1 MarR family transcriptional regulator [Olivibacter sp. SDN3]